MDLQKPLDYKQMFQELVTRRVLLMKQRDETELELVKVAQLLSAMYPLLSEQDQKRHEGTMQQVENESGGLQDAIKLVFSRHEGELLTPSQVRANLVEIGFDFKNYQANPLASINTTLRRLVPAYLKSVSTGEGVAYRRKEEFRPKLGTPAPLKRHTRI